MKKVILCVIVAAAVFVGLYNFNVITNVYFALLAALLAYFAMNLIVSDDKASTDLDLGEKLGAKEIVDKCSTYVKLIGKTAAKIEDEKLTDDIFSLCGTTDKILAFIEANPSSAAQMRKFMQYYLPVIYKILSQYDEIEDQRLTSSEAKNVMNDTAEIVAKLKIAFSNKLNDLNSGKVMDTDAEIEVLNTMLENDGLTKDNDFTFEKKGLL